MESVIVLTKNYQYWTEISIEKMLRLWQNNKIEVLVEREDRVIRGVSVTIKCPAVVRLLKFVGFHIKSDVVNYSPQAVYDRDNGICQYFHYDRNGKSFQYKCKTDEKTIDHVIPRNMGGKTIFENCVTACWHCNIVLKQGLTPERAGMKLIKKPVIPYSQKKGDMMVMTFRFNPNSVAHTYYMEKILKMG